MLILSLLALFAGPLLYHWMLRGGLVARTLDRLIVVVLVVVVVLVLVPESVAALGLLAVGLIAAGYLAPGLLEAGIKGAAQTFHLLSLGLACLGLVLHAALDGAGLAGSELIVHNNLAMAIVLHRMGVGLVLWMMIEPAFGRGIAIAVLLLVCAATVLGNVASEWILPYAGDNAVMVIQALIIGMIIHSLVHREHLKHQH